MGENGFIEKIVGGEKSDLPELSKAPEVFQAARAADAVALFVAMDESRFSSKLSVSASEYLDKQRELTERVIRNFDSEDSKLATDQARLAVHVARRKLISDWLRIPFEFALAVIPLIVTAGMSFLIYGAMISHSVIVDTFLTPTALASSGITGQTVASNVLDELQEMRGATRSTPTLDAKSAWSSEVKIEVPETGISVGELIGLLHRYLGKDIHIQGDLVQKSKKMLTLTVRGDGIAPMSFIGSTSDLADLTRKAAEYVYGCSQPYHYLAYLQNQGRFQDALKFAKVAYPSAKDDVLRSRIANGWGNTLTALRHPAEAVEKYHEAMSLQPGYWVPIGNLLSVIAETRGEEAAWMEAKKIKKQSDEAPAGGRARPQDLINVAQYTWDMPLFMSAAQDNARSNSGAGTMNASVEPILALAYAFMHDPEAIKYLSLGDPTDPYVKLTAKYLPLLETDGRDTASSAAVKGAEYWRLWLATPQYQTGDDSPCVAALALGMAGRIRESNKIFERLGPWSRCIAAHGKILEHQGKHQCCPSSVELRNKGKSRSSCCLHGSRPLRRKPR